MRGDKAQLGALHPNVRARIWALSDHPDDRRFLVSVFERVPHFIAPRFLDEYAARRTAHGLRTANLYALDLRDTLLRELLPESGLAFDATDDEIAATAARAAKTVKGMQRPGMGEAELLQRLGRTAHRYQVAMPSCKATPQIVARMRDAAWWRRALRKRFQRVEHAAIVAGCVHRRASPYVSDETLRRFDRHGRRNAELLAELEAVNLSTGEVLPLDQLAEHSLSNPANRRAAMMVCARGLEGYATERGFVGLFLTITCPSRMHARFEASGEANPAYDPASSPRVAQRYLGNLWNSATRKLKHEGIRYFGLRTVEPHHDGTPHWHLLAFVEPGQVERFAEILREYALADSPDEPGAAERRFVAKRIDPAKGSAAGYIAAYVSKNTDGHGIEGDEESGRPANEGARRAVAWARVWRVRQFQFFGAGALTPYRELYRLDRIPEALEALLGDPWRAVKAKDYRAFLAARDARGLRLGVLYEAVQSTRYPGEEAKRVRGIVCHGDAGPFPLITRPDTWAVQFRPGSGAVRHPEFALTYAATPSPWTRFNNSAHVERQGFFRVSDVADTLSHQAYDGQMRVSGAAEHARRRAPVARASRHAHRRQPGEGRFDPNRAPLPGSGLAERKGCGEA